MSCSERHKLAHSLACFGLLLLELGLKVGDFSLKAVDLSYQVSGEMKGRLNNWQSQLTCLRLRC